ncbi:MAG: 50S ribosomal protein L1, partial [Candidatus Hydrothermota bacterium]
KRGKRYRALLEKFDLSKEYSVDEAVSIVKQLASAKFDETVDMAIKLGVDPRKADQMVRGAVVLPHGTGKKVKVLVLTSDPELEKQAKEAGADYVGFKEYIDKIKSGWLDFDSVVASPDAMREVSRLGRILGPKGLMPSPKTGTVTKDVARVVKEIKKGRVEFRVDRTGNIHAPIGKVSFSEEQLKENLLSLLREILNLRPQTFRGTYVRSIHISPTMGPSVKVNVNDAIKLASQER